MRLGRVLADDQHVTDGELEGCGLERHAQARVPLRGERALGPPRGLLARQETRDHAVVGDRRVAVGGRASLEERAGRPAVVLVDVLGAVHAGLGEHARVRQAPHVVVADAHRAERHILRDHDVEDDVLAALEGALP